MRYLDESKLNEDEKKYITILKSWNLKGDFTEKGATVFKCIWDSLEAEVWKDEFSKTKLPMPWPDAPVLLQSLITDSVYAQFADNINTADKKETMQDDVMAALKKSVVKLKELEGKDQLEWGKWKDTKVSLEHMINATKEMHGPSWRMVVHLTDEIEAYGVYPGGQNGNPGSKYSDNFIDTWAAGKYYRILFLKKEQAAKHERIKWHLTLTNS